LVALFLAVAISFYNMLPVPMTVEVIIRGVESPIFWVVYVAGGSALTYWLMRPSA
jgi:hypothetical protein